MTETPQPTSPEQVPEPTDPNAPDHERERDPGERPDETPLVPEHDKPERDDDET
jgi:hypothetical protein